MAPRVGLEPTTYWLQVPSYFYKAWTISLPCPSQSLMDLGSGYIVSAHLGSAF